MKTCKTCRKFTQIRDESICSGCYKYNNYKLWKPIGLKPKYIVYEERIKEICDAIHRYTNSFMEIPVEWIYEYNDIIRYLNEKDGNKTSSNVKKPDVTTWDSAPARVPDPWCMCKECTELRGKRIDKELEKNK